jgi:bacterial group 3 Ig-like protein
MKKKLLVLSVLALSGISAATLASCDKFVGGSTTTSTPSESVPRTVTGISVTGQNTVYGIGDSIAPGASARVAINYSDGTSSDSTSTAKFDFSAVDASKAGKYTVKVTCQGKETSYEVEVKEYVFTGIEADTSKADLNYHLYTVYNFDDVVISALYKHPVTNEVTKKVLNNADVAFKVTDSNNTEIGTQFPAIGDYNVEASYNDAKCNFAVKCVPVDAKTIAEAMEVASKTESSISSGSAVYTSTYGIGSESGDSYETHTDSYDYVYGNSFVKVKKENSYNGEKRNLYYSLKSNGEPFVVAVDLDENGNETGTPYIPTDLEFNPKAIDAQYLPLNIFKDGTKYNGVYNTINALYKELEGVVGDPYQELGECSHLDNATGFKFGYNRLRSAYNRWYYERVTVEFTLTEAGAINKAYINIDKYISEENPAYGETDYEAGTALPSDLPIEIKEKQDEAGLTKKYFVFKDGADTTPSDSSNWKFNQESGVKASDDENPYLASKITVSDFKIFDANNKELNDGERISLDLDNGNSVKDEGNHRFELTFSIGNVLPETANIDLDAIDVEVSGVGKDGHIVGDFDPAYATVSNYDGSITLRFNRPGDYDVTFKTSSVTKTIHYSVDYEAPLTIEGTVHNGEKDSSFSPESSFAMYKSNKIYIGANIGDNNGGNGDAFEPGFTAVVDKTTAKLEKTTLNVNGKDVECYAFTATEAGDYVITITGAKPDSDRAAATSTLKINVADNPTLASILAKYDNKYEAVVSEDEIYSLEFTDDKFTIYNKYDHTKYAEYDYTYDAETRTFVCIPGGNASGIDKNFELTMSNYYVLSLVDVDTKASYILKKPTSDITDEDWAVLKGKYEATLGSTSYTFDFKQGDTKGEGSFTVTIGTKNCAYTYKYENETGKLLTSIAIDGNDPLSTFTLSVKNATITLSDGSNSVNLTEKKNDINEILKGTYTASFDNSGNGEYEYEITFNDNGTATLKNKNKKRERICSYTYNEETGQLKFTKISGSSSSVGIESKIYVIDGQLTYKGPVMGGSPVFSRNGGNETPDVVEVPEEYIGTWYGVDSYDNSLITVELSATTVKVTSGAVTQTFDVQTVKDGTITAGMVTLVLGNNSISYNYSNGFVTCTLSKENPLLGVSTELQGTYEGINPDSSENVTIEVGEKTVKYDGFTYTISSVENGTYKFVDKTAPNFFVLLVVGADQKITFTTDSNATFEIHLKGSSTVVEISEKYIGSWVSADGDTLVISADSVEYNGEAIEVVSASADAGIEVDNFGTSGVIFFDENGALNFRNGSLYTVFTKNNGSTSNSLIDQYVGVYDGSNDSVLTINKDKITCKSGIDVYEYTITNVTETSIVTTTIVFGVESEFKFVINTDKTIIGEMDEKFTKRNSSTVVEIDESLQGTWKDEANNITLVISASSVNWNDIECTGVAYSEGNLSFTYNDAEYVGGINSTNKLEIRTGTTEWYTFSKQTPSESNGEVDLSSYAGWYVNGNDQIAVISNGILIGKDTYTIDSKSLVDGVLTIEASLNSTSISITITGNSLVYNEVTYIKQVD